MLASLHRLQPQGLKSPQELIEEEYDSSKDASVQGRIAGRAWAGK